MAGSERTALSILTTLVSTGAVLARVGLVVTLAMLLFLVALLGYFVLPFIFVLLALGILALSATFREYAGLTARRRK